MDDVDPVDDAKEAGVGAVLVSCLGCLVVAVVVPCAAVLAYHLVLAFSRWIAGVL